MKKRLFALVLSLCMILSLVPQAAFAADSGDHIHADGVQATTEGTKVAKTGEVLAFTSDVHNGGKSGTSNDAANRLQAWIGEVVDKYGGIDVMSFGGDMGSAYLNGDSFWTYSKNAMDKVPTGVIQVHTTGNHEMSNGSFSSTSNAVKNNYKVGEVGAEGDNYVIYCLGSTGSGQSYTYTAAVDNDQVEKLESFLGNEDGSRVIFIITHFPLHYLSSSRKTDNAVRVIDALNTAANAGKTIVYLWGHNHTDSDAYYDHIYGPNTNLQYSSSESKAINFYYGAAGCMSDSEYGSGSAYVHGKGLVVQIEKTRSNDLNLSFDYLKESGDSYVESGSVTEATVSVKSVSTFVQTDELVAGQSYIIAGEADSDGNVLILSSESTGTSKQLKGVSATVSNDTITISDDEVLSKVLFNCIEDSSSSLGGLQLENGNSYLYSSNSAGLSMHALDAGRCWHYKAYDEDTDKHILWLIKESDSNGADGYSSAGGVYKYYLDYSSGTYFTDGHVDNNDTVKAASNLPKVYLYTEAPEGDTYTLSYNANGGTGSMSSQTNKTTYTVKANSFTKEGYEFIKWNTKADGTGTDYEPGDSITLTEDTTLYAQWTKATTVQHTVYVLTSSLTVGKKYLIVNTNAQTSANGAHAISNSNSTVVDDPVTVNAGIAATNNVVYIDSDDVETGSVWTVGGSSTSPTFAQGSSYLYPSSSGVSINTTSRAWSTSSSNPCLRYRSSNYGNYSYLNYNNGWTMTSSSSSTYAVYFYEETTIKVSITPGITVEPETATVGVGNTTTLTATLNNIEGTPTIAWSSDNTGVATVNQSGVVTGVATGTATITASMTYEGETYTDTCVVTVAAVDRYELVNSLDAGGEYLIVNTNTAGSAFALKNPGTSGTNIANSNYKTAITIESGSYILTSDTDIVWTAEASGSGVHLKNNGLYLEGKSGNTSVYSTLNNANRVWTYSSANQLQMPGGTDNSGNATTYTLAYSSNYFEGTASASSNDNKVYLFAKDDGSVRYNVTLPEGFDGAATVKEGTNYTFTKSADEDDYIYGDVTYTMGGGASTAITPDADGVYMIANVTGDLVISGTRTPKPKTKYVLADSLEANGQYLIVNVASGSGYALKNPGSAATISSSNGRTAVEVKNGEYIETNATDIVWTASTNGSGFNLKNGNYFLEVSSQALKTVTSLSASNRYWTYNLSSDTNSKQLIHKGGNSNYAVYYNSSNTFTASSSTTNKVYLFKLEDTTPSIRLDKQTLTVPVGETGQLTATVKNAAGVTVAWTSDNTNVATVDQTGKVSGVAAGTAKITASFTLDGTTYKAECDVTVKVVTYISFVPATTFEADKEYLIANKNTGEVYVISNEPTGSDTSTGLVGIKTNVSNGKITLPEDDAANAMFTAELKTSSSGSVSVWLKQDGKYLYTASSGGLRISSEQTTNSGSTNNTGKYWHYRSDENLLWYFKDTSSSDGYSDATSTYKYWIEYSNTGVFTSAHTTSTNDGKPSLSDFDIPDIFLFVKDDGTAHEHTYGQPIWNWAADYSSATATFACECGDEQVVTDNAPVENIITAATCTANKVVTYTATVTFNGTDYTDTTDNVTLEGTATGHTYGDPTWSWAADYSSATATFACECSDEQTVTDSNPEVIVVSEPTCTADKVVKYKATVTFNGEEYTTESEKVTVANTATGHHYDQPNWEWALDYSYAIATFRCECGDVQTLTDNAPVEIVVSDATCTRDKVVTYYATVTFNGTKYELDSENVTLENTATGHDWSEPEWTWNGLTSATATFTCANDPSHEHTETATGSAITSAQGSGVNLGHTVYTATVSFSGRTYTNDKAVINQYTLTFKDGETVVAEITQDYGTEVTAPTDPTKAFHTFSGWDPEVPETMPAENKTFTAKWTAVEGYYLIGSITDWHVVEANILTATETTGEYSIGTTLTVGDEIKVVYATGGVADTANYYPSSEHGNYGKTDNYVVDADHAGNATLYFRPAGNSDSNWRPFGGYFYIAKDHTITVSVPNGNGTAAAYRDDSTDPATGAPVGKVITVEATPANNYQLDKIELWKTNGGTAAEQTLTGTTFEMPDYDVTIKVYFKAVTWTFAGFTWNETVTPYTAVANYTGSDNSTATVDATVDSVVTAPTCTEAGYTTYTASVSDAASLDGVAHNSDPKVVPGEAATGHHYGEPTWSWGANNASATATFTCTAGDDTQTVTDNAPVEVLVSAATCTADKVVKYTAKVTFNGKEYTAESENVTVANTATGHDYGQPTWTWSANNASATATFTCNEGDDTKTVTDNAPAEVLVSAATCTADKVVKYTAKVTFNGKEYTAESENVTVANTATDHTWGAVTYTWASNNLSVTASRTCSKCNEIDSETVAATADVTAPTCTATGYTIYTSAAFQNAAFTVQTKRVDGEAATGHAWKVTNTVWASDYSKVTVTLTCEHNSTHTHSLEVTEGITSEKTKEPTAAEPGEMTYTATFTYDGQELVATGTQVLPPLGSSVVVNVKSFMSDEYPDLKVKIELRKNGALVDSDEVTGNTATCTFSSIQTGEYTVIISKLNHVDREYTVEVDANGVVLDAQINLLGDVTGDGRVRTIDAAMAYAHARGAAESEITDPYILKCADVIGNNDGVKIVDAARIYKHARGLDPLWNWTTN